jgi:outer membrane lipoprotein carrier protein
MLRSMMSLCAAALLTLSLSLASAGAQASAVDQLRQFLAGTQSARGEFAQQVTPRQGATVQKSNGRFVFQRPGKFRWVYDKPYEQVIVADGTRLHLYDKDLNQVTVKKLSAALPASPASILFGASDFEKEFTVKDDGARDGIAWVAAVPRTKDSPFQTIRIGFHDGQLAAMQLTDTFGQATALAFTKVERNPKVDPESFRFTPPPGADVLQDRE